MSIDAEIVELGAASVDPETGALLVQGVAHEESTYEDTPVYSCLGVTAMPFPADDDGAAHGMMLYNVAGADGYLVGARDTRSAKIVGAMKPGDTVLHSTGPQQAAQIQLKEEKRQVAVITKQSNGKHAGLFLDGTKDQAMLNMAGMMVEISSAGGIILTDGKGGGIHIKDGVVSIFGSAVVLGGRTPSLAVLGAPPVNAGTAVMGLPSPGVFIGINS